MQRKAVKRVPDYAIVVQCKSKPRGKARNEKSLHSEGRLSVDLFASQRLFLDCSYSGSTRCE